jgi:hypothetical protein
VLIVTTASGEYVLDNLTSSIVPPGQGTRSIHANRDVGGFRRREQEPASRRWICLSPAAFPWLRPDHAGRAVDPLRPS